MSKLLVIGGTGFFGKSILDAFQRGLLQPWHITKVIAMARSPEKLQAECPELLSEHVELVQGDIASIDVLPVADYVIHAAASTDASKYLSQGDEEKRNITMGTLNYCRLAPMYHANSKIVFCSSGAVYGYQPADVETLSEEMDFGNAEGLSESKRAYAYAKRDSEKAIEKLGTEYGLNVSIARCFAFVGKYLPKDQHFAIGNFMADILAKRPIAVKADKLVYRSYMYADNLVEWLMTLADHAHTDCPIYNVGSDEIVELHDFVQQLGDRYACPTNIAATVSADVDRYIPNVAKFNQLSRLTNQLSVFAGIDKSL